MYYHPSVEPYISIVAARETAMADRIAHSNRIEQLIRDGKNIPAIHNFLLDTAKNTEAKLNKEIKAFVKSHPVGLWCLTNQGLGPIMTAKLLTTFDVSKETAGKWWAFAGLCPGQKKVKGQKTNYSPRAKTLCFLVSKSFVLTSNKQNAYYGEVYKMRKDYETNRNMLGHYKDQALQIYNATKWTKESITKVSYKNGLLPKAHIIARSARYTVKLFLSHLHQVYREYADLPVPLPYVMGIPNSPHTRFIPPPAWDSNLKTHVGETFEDDIENIENIEVIDLENI